MRKLLIFFFCVLAIAFFLSTSSCKRQNVSKSGSAKTFPIREYDSRKLSLYPGVIEDFGISDTMGAFWRVYWNAATFAIESTPEEVASIEPDNPDRNNNTSNGSLPPPSVLPEISGSSTQPQAVFDESVMKRLAKEEIGKISYNVFDSIQVNEVKLIQIFISSDTSTNVRSVIKNITWNSTPGKEDVEVVEFVIPIGLYMSTEIYCPTDDPDNPAIEISLKNPPAQKKLHNNYPSHWEWRVKANKAGNYPLVIKAFTHEQKGNSFLPLMEKEIYRSTITVISLSPPTLWQQVSTTFKTSYASLLNKIATEPEWLLTTLLIPLFTFLYREIKKRNETPANNSHGQEQEGENPPVSP